MSNNSSLPPCSTALAYAPNPDGSPPNFNGPTFFAISLGFGCSLGFLAIAFVSIRIAESYRKDRRLHFEDYSVILALVFSVANAVLQMYNDRIARHVWDTDQCAGGNPGFAKRGAAQIMLYPSGLFFAKASICILYMQLFHSVTSVRLTALAILIIFGLAYLTTIILALVYTFPWKKEWEWGRDRPDSWSMRVFIVLLGIITVTSDIVLLSLPIRTILKLNTSLQKKIGLVTIFATGFGATVAGAVNLYFRIDFYYFNVFDFTWVNSWLNLSAEVELFVTIILSSVPGCVAAWRNHIRDTAAVNYFRNLIFTRFQISKEPDSSRSNFSEANERWAKRMGLGKHNRDYREVDHEQLQLNVVNIDGVAAGHDRPPKAYGVERV